MSALFLLASAALCSGYKCYYNSLSRSQPDHYGLWSNNITVHDHCQEQGLPELASETEIGPCNYQREGTTFVDSIENYLSTVLTLNYLPQERRLFKTRSRTDRNLL